MCDFNSNGLPSATHSSLSGLGSVTNYMVTYDLCKCCDESSNETVKEDEEDADSV